LDRNGLASVQRNSGSFDGQQGCQLRLKCADKLSLCSQFAGPRSTGLRIGALALGFLMFQRDFGLDAESTDSNDGGSEQENHYTYDDAAQSPSAENALRPDHRVDGSVRGALVEIIFQLLDLQL
jgi:hypothetical protein